MKIEKTETHYQIQLKVSEYDYLKVVADTSGRITINFLDTRWRTPQETIDMLKEIIGVLAQMEQMELTKP